MQNIKYYLVFILILCTPAISSAKFYVRPIFGFTVPIRGGDASYAVGGAIGYSLFDSLSVETSYTRLMAMDNGFDNNLVTFSGTYSFFLPGITPFAKLGGGFYKLSIPGIDTDFEGFVEFGSGAVLTFLPLIDFGAGISYMALFETKDLIYPYFYVGLSI